MERFVYVCLALFGSEFNVKTAIRQCCPKP